ncbi:hypothetical protein N0B16_04110 [Chryseobacterium sp. GMJ5]|uniref:BioF2-like acetyltransferase domain-containing protein n=1 Tax=Chryseobacterium gilvum TaxID=2976534 RepID=A0ABT2VUC9_9FLAO|nr:hypothetical protein [Chryseobacterium gilvum]MCU7613614.1 hypothetical protein [Chryseobacterium gilvum]
MIRRLKYRDIDFEKYTNCVEQSEQKNVYARKEILDHLSEHWELLVYEDYQAVMPVPVKKKLRISFVFMPLFCQQLGIFSGKDNVQINDLFLKYLKRNFIIFNYAFNHINTFSDDIQTRKNYVIPVCAYQDLRKHYFKGRKSTVKCAQQLDYKELILNEELITFIENNFKGLSKEADYKKFKEYIYFLDKEKKIRFCGAFLDQKLINLAVLIADNDQLYLLGLINKKKYKEQNGPSFLIDMILKNNIHESSFNFMGSNIRGIEVFFKSFGAVLQPYQFVENNILKKFL